MNWQSGLMALLPYVPALLLAVSAHESAHALAAHALGDSTAKDQGRISLYPPRHIDLFGTLILPILSLWQLRVFYGYARPTPVDPGRLRRPKADFSLVALAGPCSNLALALLSGLAGHLALLFSAPGPVLMLFAASMRVNVTLGLVNLLPLPGLDGMKALYVALPDAWCWRLSQADRFAIFYLALAGMIGALSWMGWLVEALLRLSGRATGFPI